MEGGMSEQARLLSNLNAFEDEAYTGIQQWSSLALEKKPEWSSFLAQNLLNQTQVDQFESLHDRDSKDKSTFLVESKEMLQGALNILPEDLTASKYILALLYDSTREDPRRLDNICASLKDCAIYDSFLSLIRLPNIDFDTADKAAYILSGLFSRAPSGLFHSSDIDEFLKSIANEPEAKTLKLSDFGRLSCLCNLLKIQVNREIMWNYSYIPQVLLKNLKVASGSNSRIPLMYLAAFCVWLFSFNSEFIPRLNGAQLTEAICKVLKETRVEKIVRVCLRAIKNFVKNDDAAEIIIELNLFQVLTLFEYEKWRDLELYDEVRDAIYQLDQKIKHFSNFDRYKLELEKGKLRWSILHSEKFWKENVMAFEQDQFATICQLSKLLDCSDTMTVAVVAYDIGEFARFHPAGRRVCKSLGVKDKLMVLITSKDRTVARESLLCVQKLMLKNWKDAAFSR